MAGPDETVVVVTGRYDLQCDAKLGDLVTRNIVSMVLSGTRQR